MPVNDIFRYTVYIKSGTQVGLNVWYFRLTAIAIAEMALAEMANNFFTQKALLMTPLFGAAAQLSAVGVRRVFTLPQSLEAFSNQAEVPGTASGDLLPRQTAGITTLRTPLAGRANRGRKYWPFPAESLNEADASPVVGYLTNLVALMDTIVPTMTLTSGAQSNTFNPVVFRRTNPATSPAITTYTNRDKWATQRRRGAYGAPNVSPV